MQRWMRSMRAKCFSCESHPEIGSRFSRRRERQVFSVHVDHQSKVYFSYCPSALIRVLAWRLCTKISTSRFNVKCFHWNVQLCFHANNHQIVNIGAFICGLMFSGIICCRLFFGKVFRFIAISVAFNAIHGDLLCTILYAYFRTALEN